MNKSFSNLTSDQVSAVVITFFPDAGFPARLKKIAAQVSRVIIVDNATTGESVENLEKALGVNESVTCILNRENLGVAAALNQGIRRALEEDCSWIVTFDQDSLPALDMVEKLLAAWKAHPQPERLLLAGPRITFLDSTFESDSAGEPPWREVMHVITSGSLISRRTFELAGNYNEGLFIDYVDIEYCLRLKALGYQIIEVPATKILHQMGRIEERIFLGVKVHPTHHQPLRRYYQFRNALLLHRQYGDSQRPWRRKNQILLFKMLILILLYEKKRLPSLFQLLKGIGHGLAGRAGRDGETNYLYDPIKIS